MKKFVSAQILTARKPVRRALLTTVISILFSASPLVAAAAVNICAGNDPMVGGSILCDDFSSVALDSSKWQSGGYSVSQANEILTLSADVTDNTGWVRTRQLGVAKIAIHLRHWMQPSTDVVYSKDYFFPSITLQDDTGAAIAGLVFLRSLYGPDHCGTAWPDTTGKFNRVLLRTKSDSCVVVGTANSDTYYGRWLETYISYDSATGNVLVDLDADGTIDLNYNIPVADRKIVDNVRISGYGWNRGHIHKLDYVSIGAGVAANPTQPTVSSITPSSGPTAGGTTVSLIGLNFLSGAAVTFGGVPASNVVVISPTNITCKSPISPTGGKAVTVTNPGAPASAQAVFFTYYVEVVPTDPRTTYIEESSVTQRVEVPGGADGNTAMVFRFDLTPQPPSYPRLEIWSGTNFVPLEQNPTIFDTSKPSLLVIHGWQPWSLPLNRSLDDTFVDEIGHKLSNRNNINILAWNWLKQASDLYGPPVLNVPYQASINLDGSTYKLYERLTAFIAATNYGQKIHIFGHSLGALIAVNITYKLLGKDQFNLIDQLTLADPPDPLGGLKNKILDLTWDNGTRRPLYIDNLRSQFGATYEGITNVNFRYGLPKIYDINASNHSFGYQWYFGIGNIPGLEYPIVGATGCPNPSSYYGNYGAHLSNVLSNGCNLPNNGSDPNRIAVLRAAFQDQPGDPVSELAMLKRDSPYELDLGAFFSLSQLAATVSGSQLMNFTIQDGGTAGSTPMLGASWHTFSGGNVIFDQGRALGVTSSPVILTATVTFPTDILYMSFDVSKSTGLPNDILSVYFDSSTLIQFSGEAFASSTDTFSLGPIDISGYAGRTGALTLVYASTQPGITVTFANMAFTSGTVQPVTPSLQSAAANINNVRIYPIPWQPNSNGKYGSANVAGCGTGLIFNNLTSEGTIRIYNIPGDLVREIAFISADNGCTSWDGKNAAGRNVASGVYIAIIKNTGAGGGNTIKKLAIER